LLPLFGVLPGDVPLSGAVLLLPGEVVLPGDVVPEVPDPLDDLRRVELLPGVVELPGDDGAVFPGIRVASGGFFAAGAGVAPGEVLGAGVLSRVVPGGVALGWDCSGKLPGDAPGVLPLGCVPVCGTVVPPGFEGVVAPGGVADVEPVDGAWAALVSANAAPQAATKNTVEVNFMVVSFFSPRSRGFGSSMREVVQGRSDANCGEPFRLGFSSAPVRSGGSNRAGSLLTIIRRHYSILHSAKILSIPSHERAVVELALLRIATR
jgi:hypothetical protein